MGEAGKGVRGRREEVGESQAQVPGELAFPEPANAAQLLPDSPSEHPPRLPKLLTYIYMHTYT